MSILWYRGWFKDAIDALELLTIRLSEFSGDDLEEVLTYIQTKKSLGEFYYLIADVNADPWTIEMLVSVSELLNGMKEKSIAITLASLLVDHPMTSTELKARAVRLYDDLSAAKIQPKNRDWSLDQLSRVVGDLKFILERKSSSQ